MDLISPIDFNFISTKLREFFSKKGLIEVATQHRLSILAACEDPSTVSSFQYDNNIWPLPQTGQMWLEYELLTNPSVNGYFCCTTSYRNEQNPVKGRHNLIFPMFEFEIHGDLEELIKFEREMLEYLGFGDRNSFPEGEYMDLCKKYGVDELTHEHEAMILKDFGSVFFLKNFPESTSPFFNMNRDQKTGLAKKVDVIVNGIETFGSAERGCNPEEMRKLFYSISDGKYAEMLFDKFGKERVEKELETFLSHKFTLRSGCGIGVNRLISGCKAKGLL